MVQIDEFVFKHKPKVAHHCLILNSTSEEDLHHNCGCLVWLIHHIGVITVVSHRYRATLYLISIIHQFFKPRTTTYSDEWSAYRRIATFVPNVNSHSFVNHSVSFVDPTNGVHTQNAESYWNQVKTKLKSMKRCLDNQLPLYLDKFMWRERNSKTSRQVFDNIVRDISLKYPV